MRDVQPVAKGSADTYKPPQEIASDIRGKGRGILIQRTVQRTRGMGKEMLFNSEESEVEASLTERQAAFLTEYRRHKTARKAAHALGVTEDTAQKHLRLVAKKLGFSCIRDIIANEIEPSQRATAGELMQKLKEQEYKCALTGQDLVPEKSQLDHIVPRKKGGSDRKDNLQWVTSKVNRMKGSMSNEEFIRICGNVWRKAVSQRPQCSE